MKRFALVTPPRLWLAVLLSGVGAGVSAIVLTRILLVVQHLVWPAPATMSILDAARSATATRHVVALIAAGLLTGLAQVVLVRLPSGNSNDLTEAIAFDAGRLPRLRTLGSAVLSVVVVGMGAALGREGAPKQAAAVIANLLADRTRLTDDQRRLLVASAAGAGMAAAYGVPLGGALFAIEVLRGSLALRMVLPALVTSLVATAVAWLGLPDAPTYDLPAYGSSASVVVWALVAGPIAGLVSVVFVRLVAFADRSKPKGWLRVVAPTGALGILGVVSIAFPQLLGNGKDIAQLAFLGGVAPLVLLVLLVLRPAATVACLGSGTPGGLFTPSLALGAILGGLLGQGWSLFWPGVPPGLFAVCGAAAVLAATTQGPISSVVLIIELTGHDRSFILPLLVAVTTATFVARSLELRSIYEARLSPEQVEKRRGGPPAHLPDAPTPPT